MAAIFAEMSAVAPPPRVDHGMRPTILRAAIFSVVIAVLYPVSYGGVLASHHDAAKGRSSPTRAERRNTRITWRRNDARRSRIPRPRGAFSSGFETLNFLKMLIVEAIGIVSRS